MKMEMVRKQNLIVFAVPDGNNAGYQTYTISSEDFPDINGDGYGLIQYSQFAN